MSIAQSIQTIHERITNAALRAKRQPSAVTLVAVSKTFSAEAVREAIAAGQQDFGENRVEEALPKKEAVNAPVRWHLVGHVQTRKAKDVVGQFNLIHSVDTLKLAEALDRRAEAAALQTPVSILLECNVSGEKSKAGFALAGWETERALFEAFAKDVETMLHLPHIHIAGLMTMAPIVENPSAAKPFFASLRRLQHALRQKFPQLALNELSMGMSDDFEAAIEEGSTMVRIGRAIFSSE